MSIINKMLQDLDKRQAAPNPAAPGGPDSSNMAQQVRPVKSSAVGSHVFWRVMAGIMVVVVAWVIWVMWQITPRSVVTDLAYQSFGGARTAPPASAQRPIAPAASMPGVPAPAAPAPVAAVAPLPAAAPAAPPPVAAGAARPAEAAPAVTPAPPKIDMLRLATELATPINVRRAKPAPAARSPGSQTVAAVSQDARAAKAAERPAEPAAKAEPRAALAALAVAPNAARIDKRVDVTPRERAESEFRRAMGLVNQGRMAEGMEGLKVTLEADSTYELARQTLVALLLEAKRTDEAAGLLQEGLAMNPANVGYAMLLARIYVERGDPRGALALLQKYETTAKTSAVNAEYHGFLAALYQRLGRHIEAVAQYQGALRLTPGVGAWWVGLGISQAALSRKQDATESFQRAKNTGNLNAGLLAYVDGRLKQPQ